MAAALEGLKVVDLAWVVAGPAIGRALADYGATVVRVESSVRIETARFMGPFPGGKPDPQRSALFDTYNTGKLGLALDLGREEARAVVMDLVRWADVLIESFAPGQMARWGLGPDTLREANRGLVGVSTSLMGLSGPYASFAGYGNVGAAVAGFQGLAGQPDALPLGPYGPYTDFIGPRFGLVALLAALDHRSRTGEGCWLDVSQAEAGMQFLGPQIADCAETGHVPAVAGNRDPQFAPHGVFRCAGDDAWVAVAVRDDAEWTRLATLLPAEARAEDLRTLADRKAREDQVEDLVAQWCGQLTAAEAEETLQALGIPAHGVSSSADMIADVQLAARGHFVRLPHPLGGESVVDASRFRLSETPAAYARPAPHFGRDARHVLVDLLGYDAGRFTRLEEAGVLR